MYTTGHLSYGDVETGVLYGFLQTIDQANELFSPVRTIFAFDFGGPGRRKEVYPEYKANREKERSPEDQLKAESLWRQIQIIWSEYLPALGYRNIIRIRGYEGDDIIAQAVNELPYGHEAVILSGDEDLWQCLNSDVIWHSPLSKHKRTVSSDSFRAEWGLDPVMWADIKALAGCGSDNVKGLEGVGEKTAAKWFTGKLKPTSKAYKTISAGLDVHNRNLPIVKLPYPGIELPEMVDDQANDAARQALYDKLGFRDRRAGPASRQVPRESRRPDDGFDFD